MVKKRSKESKKPKQLPRTLKEELVRENHLQVEREADLIRERDRQTQKEDHQTLEEDQVAVIIDQEETRSLDLLILTRIKVLNKLSRNDHLSVSLTIRRLITTSLKIKEALRESRVLLLTKTKTEMAKEEGQQNLAALENLIEEDLVRLVKEMMEQYQPLNNQVVFLESNQTEERIIKMEVAEEEAALKVKVARVQAEARAEEIIRVATARALNPRTLGRRQVIKKNDLYTL